MGKQKTHWPTDREVRLRFILFALLDVASAQGAPAEVLLPAHKLLSNKPTQAQLCDSLAAVLACEEMAGFRFAQGTEADDVMRSLADVT
ncbi:hypothetical protein AO391_13550 [Pseudomonas marginalis ICMP 9505]|nr:hypothetical protein AO391_13550 [Pseudomonas marginalis ICMP 9505]